MHAESGMFSGKPGRFWYLIKLKAKRSFAGFDSTRKRRESWALGNNCIVFVNVYGVVPLAFYRAEHCWLWRIRVFTVAGQFFYINLVVKTHFKYVFSLARSSTLKTDLKF